MKKKLVITFMALLPFQSLLAGNVDMTPHGTQPGLNFSIQPSSNCSSCHKGGNVSDDIINMPHGTWVGTMKANATRDPLFWAALDVANNDLPGIGDFCLRCHTPTGWYGGRVVKPVNEADPLIDGANGCELSGTPTMAESKLNDYGGVNCHFCHRLDPEGPNGEIGILHNGEMWVDDVNCSNGGFGPCRKGPYGGDDYNGANGSSPPHVWIESDYIQTSEFCGTCHNITSPTIDTNGTLEPAQKLWHNGVETDLAMPIERTYTEWLQSDFSDLIFRDPFNDLPPEELPVLRTGESCQSCHMPQSPSDEARACTFDPLDGDGNGRRKGDLRTHQFAGGNTWIPQVIKSIYGTALEANDSSPGRLASLDLTTDYAMNMLQNESADVEVTVISQVGDNLTAAVKVTNLTGHKLPTGYAEGRRMWINVQALDGSDEVFWESGVYDEMTGVLTEDAQIKIYESLQGIWNPSGNDGSGACETTDGGGNKVFHFVLNDCVYKDNRIPPKGFTGGSDLEVLPVGITYPADPERPNSLVNFDITNYSIDTTGQTGPFKLQATLKFQVSSKEYIDFLADEATAHSFETENQMCDRTWTEGPADQSRGAFMKTLWETHGRSAPVDMVMDFLEVSP